MAHSLQENQRGEQYFDSDMAYLLGMIMARGELFDDARRRLLTISFPFRSETPTLPEGSRLAIDFETGYRMAIEGIRTRIQQLLGEFVDSATARNLVTLTVAFPQVTIAWRNIKALCGGRTTYRHFSIPPAVIAAPVTQQHEFVRGFVDAAAIPSASDVDPNGLHRISIQIQHDNWGLPIQLCSLIQCSLGVPVQNILWGHPNLRAPSGGTAWAKEHRMRVYADRFLAIGFAFPWKQQVLQELAQVNSAAAGRSTLCDPRKRTRGTKPPNEEESNPKLPPVLRGKHFNSFRGICRRLGCRQRHLPQTELFPDLDDE
jgi:hypothetical protein